MDTHVLLDESGVPLLRGTQAEMMEQSLHCLMMGIPDVKVEPITSWNWSMINWGD